MIETFSQRFNKLLADRNLTCREFAWEEDIPLSTVNHWSRGDSVPRSHYLTILAKFFDVSIEYLMYGDRSTKRNTTTRTSCESQDQLSWISDAEEVNINIWKDKYGRNHNVRDMASSYIENCINMCERIHKETLKDIPRIMFILTYYPQYIERFEKELDIRDRYGKR